MNDMSVNNDDSDSENKNIDNLQSRSDLAVQAGNESITFIAAVDNKDKFAS